MRKLISIHLIRIFLSVCLVASGICALTLYCSAGVMAQVQERYTLRGSIVGPKGEPVVGAKILVKGQPNRGAISSTEGQFSISVSRGEVLEISSIGFVMQVLKVEGQQQSKVILKEDTQRLNEVVVTALGIKRQTKALAYNAQELKGELLSQGKDANFLNGLNGKVAGVTINQSSSGVGSSTRVVMRGVKSISKSNNALYVIDGVPLLNVGQKQGQGQFHSSGSTDAASDIDPDNIASVTILTGASAAALYGSEAANGAILITTKSGSEGRLKASYSFTDEWGKPMILPKFQNRYGSDGNIDSWGHLLSEDFPKYQVREFFNTANTRSHNFSLSGGSKMNQTLLSLGYTKNKGLIPNNAYERFNISGRNTTKMLNERLKLDLTTNYVNEYHRNMINQGEYMNPMVPAYMMPRGLSGIEAKQYESFAAGRNIWEQNWVYGTGGYTLQNPYWVAYRNLREVKRERYLLSANAAYELLKWSEAERWSIAARVSYDKTNILNTDKRFASTTQLLTSSKNGYYGQAQGYTAQQYADVISSLNKTLSLGSKNVLSLDLSLGASVQDAKMDMQLVEGPLSEKGYPNVFNIFNIDQGHPKTNLLPSGWHEQTQSIFASAELGFNSYLYLTLTGRNDWASQLANSPQSSFFYPSVGLSAVITEMLSEETRARLNPVLGFLKLRAAYASVAAAFQRGLTTPTYLPNTDSKTYNPNTYYPIGKLYPERTNSYEVGLSSRWFKGLFTFDASWYKTLTRNQTIFVKVPPGSGWNGIYIQTGEVQNQGIELAAGLHLGSREGLFYNSNFTFSTNANEILQLADNYVNPITGERESKSFLTLNSFGSLSYILKKGGTLGDVYTTQDFARDVDGQIHVGQNGTVGIQSFTEDKAVKLGSVLPKSNWGWNQEIGYKNLSLGALITARVGGVVVSMTEAALDNYGVSERSAIARDQGGVIIGNAMIPAEHYYGTRGKNRLAQYYTYDATNVRLAELNLSYKIGRKHLANLADLTLSLVGRNLCFLYNKAPFDPESISGTANFVQGLDYFMMPTQSTYGFSLKLAF